MGGLTFALATMLVIANRRLHVEEDPRLDVVEDMLPHANCGACGYPGCRPFAEALLAHEALPGKCTVSDAEGRSRIADFLGVDVGQESKRVARLACAGGSNVARVRAHYDGPLGAESCRAAALVAGGGKACFWGCLGHGDCETACTFDAIHMDRHDLPRVDEDACTACGDCVEVCPKDLFSIVPAEQRLWVACKSLGAGDGLLEDCRVACTACARCEMDGDGTVRMEGNLPVVDPSRGPLTRKPIERCPTGAIVWIDAERGAQRGAHARPVARRTALDEAAT